MFTISVKLRSCDRSGLQALDMRRRLGLKDGSYIWIYGGSASCQVDESFARAWFDSRSNASEAVITNDMLVAGECVEEINRVQLAPLTPERVKELYLAARFAGCREQVARLTRERDELPAQLEEREEESEE